MPDSVEHGRVVLSAIVAGGGSEGALFHAAQRLAPDHFTDRTQQILFALLVRYADSAGGVLTRGALSDLLRDKPPGTEQLYGEAYDALAARAPEPHEFRHSVAQLIELAAERSTGLALAQGRAIIATGLRAEDGTELRGHAAARAHVMAAFAGIEQQAGLAVSPQGNVIAEGDDILAAYARAKDLVLAGHVPGIQFGLPELDRHLRGGVAPGELALLLAWTTGGKSSLCVQIAWHNVVVEGKNAVIFATEQGRRSLAVKVVARHSCLPKFGLSRGLNSSAIRSGHLTDEEERILATVLADMKTGGYGHLEIVQMPEVATVSGMAARFAALARQFSPDVVLADYLGLFTPEKSRRDAAMHENLAGVVKSAHRWAQAALDGAGVPLISPWQVSKDARVKMKSSGSYDLDGMGQTHEAAMTPGIVLAIADRVEDTSEGRSVPLEFAVLKNRDGPRGRRFPVTADFATSRFTDRVEDIPDLDGL